MVRKDSDNSNDFNLLYVRECEKLRQQSITKSSNSMTEIVLFGNDTDEKNCLRLLSMMNEQNKTLWFNFVQFE